MEAKLFEIRDRGTFIPMLAVRCRPGNVAEHYLLSRSGYGTSPETQGEYVLLTRLGGDQNPMKCDPILWGVPPQHRTLWAAHRYMLEHWDELESGEVIDVEFNAGETKECKISERLEGTIARLESHFQPEK